MPELLPNLLRAAVSTVMNIVLLMTLLQPKYSKKITCFVMLFIWTADFGVAVYCYLSGSLTLLAQLDFVLFGALCFIVRPFFRDTFAQWMFSYLTVQNISCVVVVLSFLISRYLPAPVYANILLRLVLFLGFYFLFRYTVCPLYRQLTEHWNVFFYVALVTALSFTYFLVSGSNVVEMFTQQAVPLLLVIALAVSAYASIFYSLKVLSQESSLREENLKLQNAGQLLRQSVHSMEQRISLMDEFTKQTSIVNHDRKHLNHTLQELLEQGHTAEALALLKDQQMQGPPLPAQVYCENPAVNAAIAYYSSTAQKGGIACKINAQIPPQMQIDSLELSVVLSNLMENAIHACSLLPAKKPPYLKLTALYTGQLIIEIENPFEQPIILDGEGYPTCKSEGHGIGTKSVLAFVRRYNGEILYRLSDGLFNVRLLV